MFMGQVASLHAAVTTDFRAALADLRAFSKEFKELLAATESDSKKTGKGGTAANAKAALQMAATQAQATRDAVVEIQRQTGVLKTLTEAQLATVGRVAEAVHGTTIGNLSSGLSSKGGANSTDLIVGWPRKSKSSTNSSIAITLSRNSHQDGRSGPSVEAGGCQTTVRQ